VKDMIERPHSDLPDGPDLLEGVLLLITGTVVAGPMLPGLLLCVPGILFFGAAGAVLLVIGLGVAIVSAVAGAVLAVPFLAARALKGRWRPAPMPPVRLPSAPPMPAVMPPSRKRMQA
jgi:hypothetical protein